MSQQIVRLYAFSKRSQSVDAGPGRLVRHKDMSNNRLPELMSAIHAKKNNSVRCARILNTNGKVLLVRMVAVAPSEIIARKRRCQPIRRRGHSGHEPPQRLFVVENRSRRGWFTSEQVLDRNRLTVV